MTITAAEQYLIELINRARMDPLGEAARYGIDLNDGVDEPITGDPKQVLAPNQLLEDAAQSHSEWMLATNIFDHTGVSGTNARQRMEAEGYSFEGSWAWGENISWRGTTGTLDLEAVIEVQHQDLFLSSGHRENLLNESFREIGIAQVEGPFWYEGTTYNASMVTQNFAKSGSDVFVTGVAYLDLDNDDFYSIGEGLGGVNFAADGGSDTTVSSGGYSVAVSAQSGLLVTVTVGGDVSEVRVDASTGNVKLDYTDDHGFLSDQDLELVSGVTKAKLIGIADADLTGNAAGNRLIGNTGDNTISGEGGRDMVMGNSGNDILSGDGGNDRLVGGGGSDTLNGGEGNDNMSGGFGRDVLIAGSGNDVLAGGLGPDEFVFADGSGFNRITDFQDGDTVNLAQVGGITDWNDLAQNHLGQTQLGAMISDGTTIIILEGVDMATLDAGDFDFGADGFLI